MIKRVLLLSVFFLMTLMAPCQIVQMSNSRPDYKIHLAVDGDILYEATIKASKYVIMDSVIQIYPGEKLFLEADFKNDNLTNFKIVPNIVDNSKTITLEFLQEVSGKKHKQMVLTVDNPFNQKIAFNAIISRMIDKTTSITPNLTAPASSKSSYTWPDILTSLLLKSFKLI